MCQRAVADTSGACVCVCVCVCVSVLRFLRFADRVCCDLVLMLCVLLACVAGFAWIAITQPSLVPAFVPPHVVDAVAEGANVLQRAWQGAD